MEAAAPAMPAFEWYAVIDPTAPLEQGDLLLNFPIPILAPTFTDQIPAEGAAANLPGEIKSFDVIVMTQSCDFAKLTDTDDIVLCPHNDYFEVIKVHPELGKGSWKPLLEGRRIGICLIDRCRIAGHEFDYRLVSLQQIFTVPLGAVRRFAARQMRVRLLPPYREYLAQAFAKQFMRVGLPIDLPREFPTPAKYSRLD